jgi:glycerate kinase
VALADGGEGTLDALLRARGGQPRRRRVCGPLGERRLARWAVLGDGQTAVVEMAEAAGLPLVPPEKRNPLRTTTYGVGELIRAALDEPGIERVLIGAGGSATCDGGLGAAQALGVVFLDAAGRRIPEPARGSDLPRLGGMDLSGLDTRLARGRLCVLCDVTNPLLGRRGAARTFAPQKGASPRDVERLEEGLKRLARLWKRAGLGAWERARRAGAAGGLAAGLAAWCGAELAAGSEVIADTVGLDAALAGARLILTGEGAFNAQSLEGKVVSGVAARGRAHGIPVVVLAGDVARPPRRATLRALGIHGVFSLTPGPMTEPEAMRDAARLLERLAENVAAACFAAREAP